MKKLVLPRDYTMEEMLRGEGMRAHPLTGMQFAAFGARIFNYDEKRELYWYNKSEPGGARQRIDLPFISQEPWHWNGNFRYNHSYSAGDPFPEHWLFNPYEDPFEPLGMWRFYLQTGAIYFTERHRFTYIDPAFTLQFPTDLWNVKMFKRRWDFTKEFP